jgi:hypothetical protein
MTSNARTLFIEARNQLAQERWLPGFPEKLQGPWAKMDTQLAKLAFILAAVRGVDRVEQLDMERATRLIDYFKFAARKVYKQVSIADPDDGLASALTTVLTGGGYVYFGTISNLHSLLQAIDKEVCPQTVESLGVAVRRIVRKSPALELQEETRSKERKIRLTLKRLSNLSNLSIPPADKSEKMPKTPKPREERPGSDGPENGAAHGQTLLGIMKRAFRGKERANADLLEETCVAHGMSKQAFKRGLAWLDKTGRIGYHFGLTHRDSYYYLPKELEINNED